MKVVIIFKLRKISLVRCEDRQAMQTFKSPVRHWEAQKIGA